ncbi:ThiF family adenylyltransferase [Falsarthrobacter nasiphocae]|uniref:Adenylyltransferase/sulfurtransferase n=1 Tax=Falsarthrobacter nasiphocae TaxID=189863 RepID=A0AAE3YJQ5_9MICC|nr:ThiF family adenylyltransferase [Falsarthrobacter nasiphocae]MDR6892951.1 adenylyltransferase/sulfurtransferase [Falsarthrobacter nasiphocae]
MTGSCSAAGPGPAPRSSRHSRQVILPGIGEEGQAALGRARVLVIGAGGLGAPVIAYLAAAGVGHIGIVDTDVVDESNLQRQIIHRTQDVGAAKTDSAARFVTDLDPAVDVSRIRAYVDDSTALGIARGYDLIVDGADNFETRYAAADAAARLGIPHVWGAILRFEGHVCAFHEPDGPGYRDLFPETPSGEDQPNCATAGVLGALCGVIGATMAVDALKLLTGAGETPVGSFRTYDALSGAWRSLRICRDPDRAPLPPAADDDAAAPPQSPPATAALLDVTADDLRAELASGRPPVVVDLREEAELAAGSIPGALHIPLEAFLADPAQAGTEDVVLYCASGVRSRRALSALASLEGARRVRHVRGGFAAWA